MGLRVLYLSLNLGKQGLSSLLMGELISARSDSAFWEIRNDEEANCKTSNTSNGGQLEKPTGFLSTLGDHNKNQLKVYNYAIYSLQVFFWHSTFRQKVDKWAKTNKTCRIDGIEYIVCCGHRCIVKADVSYVLNEGFWLKTAMYRRIFKLNGAIWTTQNVRANREMLPFFREKYTKWSVLALATFMRTPP